MLFIVTVVPPTVVADVLVPLPLTTRPPASDILTAAPEAFCVLGKELSFAIAVKPPKIESWLAT